ncbi:MAG TPA: acyltransferase family protein [Dermatophilaceae bacterium]|nr:acyltransferase family protein [Dermatophilaceae bacterium]
MAVGRATRTAASASPVTRVPWIDKLKILVIAGVIVVHSATAYILDISWYYEERTSSELTGYIAGFPALTAGIYGLGPLFLVGGWLSSASLARRGVRDFARSRLVRLGIPALVYFLLVDPFTDWLGDRAEGKARSLGAYLVDPFGDRDLGPVWFVVALLAFSLAYAAVRLVRPRRFLGSERLGVPVLVVVALAIAVGDLVVWHWWGFFDRTLWNLNWAHWPQAVGMFTLGALAGERGWFSGLPRRVSVVSSRVTIAAILALFALAAVYLIQDSFESLGRTLSPGSLVFELLDGITAVAIGLWVVSSLPRHWNALPSPPLARAARGAYAAYLLHPPVLVALSAAARPLATVPEVKFLLVAALGVPACFAIGYLTTRVPVLRRVL